MLAVYLVWGSTYLVIRFTVETLPPFLSAGLRFLVSGLVLLAWRHAAGDDLPTLSQWRSAAIVGTLLLLGGNGLVCWAEQTVPSGVAALFIGAVPMFLVTPRVSIVVASNFQRMKFRGCREREENDVF